MEIVVGSKNEIKRLAVADAFERSYPDQTIQVSGVAADSGISDHPTSAAESMQGAINRAKHARELKPEADYCVGIEGGLLQVDERAWEHSWVAIEDKEGTINTGVSAGLELQGKLLKAILTGEELSVAFEKQFGMKDMGKKNGMYGQATDNLITRQGATAEAVIFALAPFKHPEYFK